METNKTLKELQKGIGKANFEAVDSYGVKCKIEYLDPAIPYDHYSGGGFNVTKIDSDDEIQSYHCKGDKPWWSLPLIFCGFHEPNLGVLRSDGYCDCRHCGTEIEPWYLWTWIDENESFPKFADTLVRNGDEAVKQLDYLDRGKRKVLLLKGYPVWLPTGYPYSLKKKS